MLNEKDWITDRPPTEKDKDKFGLILLKGDYIKNIETNETHLTTRPISVNEYLTKGFQSSWKHTKQWCDSHKKETRQVIQITGYPKGIIALADDGTVWFAEKLDHSYKFSNWEQIPGLPDKTISY